MLGRRSPPPPAETHHVRVSPDSFDARGSERFRAHRSVVRQASWDRTPGCGVFFCRRSRSRRPIGTHQRTFFRVPEIRSSEYASLALVRDRTGPSEDMKTNPALFTMLSVGVFGLFHTASTRPSCRTRRRIGRRRRRNGGAWVRPRWRTRGRNRCRSGRRSRTPRWTRPSWRRGIWRTADGRRGRVRPSRRGPSPGTWPRTPHRRRGRPGRPRCNFSCPCALGRGGRGGVPSESSSRREKFCVEKRNNPSSIHLDCLII